MHPGESFGVAKEIRLTGERWGGPRKTQTGKAVGRISIARRACGPLELRRGLGRRPPLRISPELLKLRLALCARYV
jgi:hypothetical protein